MHSRMHLCFTITALLIIEELDEFWWVWILELSDRPVSMQIFQIMLDVANEIGRFYRHTAIQ